MLVVDGDGDGVPLACHLDSARPSEVTLLERTLDNVSIKRRRDGTTPRPRLLILDRAYDSDPLRDRLAARGIEMVCPHRRNRRRPATQRAGRLRRYYRWRWRVERTFAWLGNFRRLLVRHERTPRIYRAFFHLACMLITMRKL
ncbi:IS5 family transposase [Isosphaeraceae bacterium EP7]